MGNEKLSDEKIKQIRDLIDQGMTYKNIMQTLNVSKKVVYKYSQTKRNKKLPEETVKQIQEMAAQDLKLDYIAMKLGICRMSVIRYTERKRHNRRWTTKKILDIAELRHKGYTWNKIGEVYNCSGESIRQMIYLHKNKMNLEV